MMEPELKKAVSRMSVNSLSGIMPEIHTELQKIQEFFLLMTICNTVVVSAHAHKDKVGGPFLKHYYSAQHPPKISQATSIQFWAYHNFFWGGGLGQNSMQCPPLPPGIGNW